MAEIRGRDRGAVHERGQRIYFGPTKSPENVSSGAYVRRSLTFLLITGGPSEPLVTTGT